MNILRDTIKLVMKKLIRHTHTYLAIRLWNMLLLKYGFDITTYNLNWKKKNSLPVENPWINIYINSRVRTVCEMNW